MNYKKDRFSRIFKIITLGLLQVILISQFACAASLGWSMKNLDTATLSPQLQVNNSLLQESVLRFTAGTGQEVLTDIDIEKLKERILDNNLIQKFFKLTQEYQTRKKTWESILDDTFAIDPKLVKAVINSVEAKGETWISQQGEIIRETNITRLSYEGTNADTGGTWSSFIDKVISSENYNLGQLLSHSLGYVINYIEMDEIERARKFLEIGYIILRSVEIESRNLSGSENLAMPDTILSNSLISMFIERGKNLSGAEDVMIYKTRKLLESQEPLIQEVISEVNGKGKAWIEAEGLKILHDFFDKPVYAQAAKVDNWLDFLAIESKGHYDFQQLFVHTIGTAETNYMLLKRLKPDSPYYSSTKQDFAELFRLGYIVLRAIDFAAQENKENQQNKQTFLPQVKLEQLSQDQALTMADRLGDVFADNNIHFLDDAMDINPKYAYSVKLTDNKHIVFLGQDPDTVYTTIGVSLVPDTYYVAIAQGEKIIGYGAIDHGISDEDGKLVISFRIFSSYRHQGKGLSARIFKTMLSGGREIFGKKINKFMLPSHQIDGDYGIESGAVLFYLKIGFKLLRNDVQVLWENKYKDKDLAVQSQDEKERMIRDLARGGMELDLNNFTLPRNSTLLQPGVSARSIDINQQWVAQAI